MNIMAIREKIKYGCVIFADFFGWLNIINKDVIDQYVFKSMHTDKYKPISNRTGKIDSEKSQNSEISLNNRANKILKDNENILSVLSNKVLIAKYKDAIEKLEAYLAKEPERSKKNDASKLISEYRVKIREAAWDSLIERTGALEDLKTELSGIIDNASHVPTVSGEIADINLFVSGVSALINEA